MNNEQSTQAGAAVLTEKQIAAGAIVRCDHGGSIGRSAAIEVFDAMRAAAPAATEPVAYMSADKTLLAFAESVDIDRPYRSFGMIPLYAAPVAAQAGQVAVPEWRGIKAVLTSLIAVASVRIADKDEDDEQLIADAEEAVRQLEARIAAAPSAPAEAQQAPAQAEPIPAEPIECWSHNEEDFNARSLGELIDDHELQPGVTVWVGEAVHPEPKSLFNTDWLIENMSEAAYDIAGEHGGEDYPNVSDEQVAELEALVVGWVEKYAPPTFWTVKDVRPYVLTAEDCSAQAPTPDVRQEGGAA